MSNRIDSRGLVTTGDGNNNTTVLPDPNNKGFLPYANDEGDSSSSPNTGAFTVASPGFYWVSGSTTCTGTLPNPSAVPMSMFQFTNIVTGGSFKLTGSARGAAGVPLFSTNGVVSGSSNAGGNASSLASLANDALTVSTSGSVLLLCDGLRYIPMASSGTLTISA